MSPPAVRRAIHSTHAVATLVLLGTGLLLEFPELRARSIGGYGRRVVEVHLWAAAVFTGIPLAALAVSQRALLAELRQRLSPRVGWGWHKVHVAGSLGSSILLALTGLILWQDAWLPRAVGDVSRSLHLALTIALAVALAIHVVAVREKLRMRVREGLGLE